MSLHWNFDYRPSDVGGCYEMLSSYSKYPNFDAINIHKHDYRITQQQRKDHNDGNNKLPLSQGNSWSRCSPFWDMRWIRTGRKDKPWPLVTEFCWTLPTDWSYSASATWIWKSWKTQGRKIEKHVITTCHFMGGRNFFFCQNAYSFNQFMWEF